MATIDTKTVLYNETFYDSTFNHPCESEATLPEYLPDISTVVRVDARPVLLSTSYKNGRVEIEGRVECIVLYTPTEGTLQSFYTRIPFDAVVTDDEFTPDARYFSYARMDSVLCRPVSGRKLAIRCTVTITLQAERTIDAQLVEIPDMEAQGLEFLTQRQKIALFIESAPENFSLEEMLELPPDSPRMERILKCDITAYPLEIRVSTGKAVIGAELSVSCLYMSNVDTGAIDQFSAVVPFNRVVEMPLVKEGDAVCAGFVVMESACGIMENAAGEERILSCKVGLRVNTVAYRNQDVMVVLDAYGKNQSVTLKTEDLMVEVAQCIHCTDFNITDSFRPREPISTVYSAEAFADIRTMEYVDGTLHLRGDLLVTFLVTLEDGEMVGLDHLFPFDRECEEVLNFYSDGVFLGECRLEEFSYEMAADGVIFVDAVLNCLTLARLQRTITAAQSVEISTLSNPDRGKYLTLYYPVEGEQLWDIGKRYSTPLREIREANSLEGEIIPHGVKILLIPR